LPGSSIGQRLVLTSFGESHGRSIGAVLDGCPAGLEINEKEIQEMLNLRKPGQNIISTQRKEGDIVEVVSGIFKGFTTGAPITMLIWNSDQKSKDYENLKTKLRPGHSDYPAMMKYNQYNDHRGGGRFSGRLTATHVMGGAIAKKLLKVTLGIEINSFTSQIGKIKMEKEFNKKMAKTIYKNEVRCPEENTAKKMRAGFRGSELFGSENNDLYTMKKGKIITKTNNSGGILGGISNGMPITMRIAFKPASSIAQKQSTVDIKNKFTSSFNNCRSCTHHRRNQTKFIKKCQTLTISEIKWIQLH